MKILLASLAIEPESRNENHPDAAYSLGLAYLQSSLEQDGHAVELLFLNNQDYASSELSFFNMVQEWKPNIVGLQIFSMNRTSSFSALKTLQKDHSNIKVVIGGIHTSVMYEQILRTFRNVIAVLGEGEQTLRDLARALENSKPIDAIQGIAYYYNGSVITTEPRPFIDDLDALPFPKHDIFFDNEPLRTVGHVITSRGCPFDCTFCCLKTISQRKYRPRDIHKVVEEIVLLKTKYPRLKQIQFHDDTFLLNNDRVIEFCKLIIEQRMDVNFICSARVKPISSEMFSWMAKAGFVKIMFGLETGSPTILESINKRITQQDVLTLFHTTKTYRFIITTFLMCGFPGETAQTIQETIDLVKRTQRINYNWIGGVGKLWVYPGTEVYRIMKERGHITDDYWMTDHAVPYFTSEHDVHQLIRFEEQMLDHLAISRILTIKGFIYQFLSMPTSIIRFLWRHPDIFLWLISERLRTLVPGLHKVLMRLRSYVQTK